MEPTVIVPLVYKWQHGGSAAHSTPSTSLGLSGGFTNCSNRNITELVRKAAPDFFPTTKAAGKQDTTRL